MAIAEQKTELKGKMETTLTTLTASPELSKGLSRYDLRMFVAKDGVYVVTPPRKNSDPEDSYIECSVHTSGKKVDYVSTDTPEFALVVNVEKQGIKATYSTIQYYDKLNRKQMITENPSVRIAKTETGLVSKIKSLIFKPKK